MPSPFRYAREVVFREARVDPVPLSQSTSRHAETARTQARPEVAQIRGASKSIAVLRSTQFSRQLPGSDTT